MEDNFNPNNFEEFLKEQVRNHRMYPTDTVWRDINKKLHGDKKWPGLTIAAFTLLSATIAICVYFTPQPDIFNVKPATNELKNSTLLHSQNNIALDRLTSSPSLASNSDGAIKNQLADNSVIPSDISVNNTNKDKNKISRKAISPDKTLTSAGEGGNKIIVEKNNNGKALENQGEFNSGSNAAASVSRDLAKNNVVNSTLPLIGGLEITPPDKIKSSGKHRAAKDDNDKNMVDGFLKEQKNDVSLYTTSKPKSLKNKFGFQIYLAPSISYRKLLEDKSVLKEGTSSGPVGLNYVADVNKVVRHRPGNGLEAGISILYNLSDNFRIKSGFQFNVRQYSIEAYRSNTELASIALVGAHGIDTVNTPAIYRNNNGFYSTELVNRYYQLAIPIGVEWEIIGNKTIQLNVAGSIQPTYLVNRNAYLISTNFKNYSENPEMVRSFNINSNIETFVSFKAGYFKWQIGPQLRYQPYSTFIPQYPIKEHLMDYGIKIGLSKTF